MSNTLNRVNNPAAGNDEEPAGHSLTLEKFSQHSPGTHRASEDVRVHFLSAIFKPILPSLVYSSTGKHQKMWWRQTSEDEDEDEFNTNQADEINQDINDDISSVIRWR